MVKFLNLRNMRILIYNWRDIKHIWAGGGEIYIFEQAKRWVTMGHEVTLFCGEDREKKLPLHEVIQGIKIYRKGGRYSLYFWAAWYYISRFRQKFDVVIDVENGVPFFTPLFCRTAKVCYVYHVHGDQFFYELPKPLSYIGFIIERYIFPLLYKRLPIVAISETTKRQLINIGLPRNNITVVYSGINGSPRKTVRPPIKLASPTILYLGRIKKYKRVDLLVTLFGEIVKKIPKARLIVAGWGTEASHLTDIIMKSPLRRKISLVGPVSTQEKRLLLSKSWVFVNPSIGEGWSIAVIEANLHGTPAVSFNVPGLAESIQQGKTGLLAKNADDLVAKICNVLTDKSLRDKLSANARTWAQSFSWDRSAKDSLRVLEKTRWEE